MTFSDVSILIIEIKLIPIAVLKAFEKFNFWADPMNKNRILPSIVKNGFSA